MKVAELQGFELDRWVAMAEGHPFKLNAEVLEAPCWIGVYVDSAYEQSRDASLIRAVRGYCQYEPYSPSTDWGWGGPIIEREGYAFTLGPEGVGRWLALGDGCYGEGPTHLIAAMRAYVASKFGDEVQ